MSEPSPDVALSTGTPGDRLDSWKEIAVYLNRDVTTVQRWEKREGMPVHRHLHDRVGSVYAFRTELDVWARSRILRAAPENGDSTPSAVPAPPPASSLSPLSRSARKLVLPLAAMGIVLVIGASLWLQRIEYFWHSPIADARFQLVTDFDGVEGSAAVSRDGHLVAFLAERDGQMDVWLTQVGSGQFHNLTRGSAPELVVPLVRNLGFSPDGSLVTFWVRRQNGSSAEISTWAVPTLGGEPRPYIERASEYDWSRDGSRLAWHTNASGDPLFVSDGIRQPQGPPI